MSLTAIRNGQKRIISVSGGLGLLQMVSSQTPGGVLVRMPSPQGGWIVRFHIGWREERSILYKGVETFL